MSRRGAYVLAEAEGGARRATILETDPGSVSPSGRASNWRLRHPTAVVSMPSWELFEAQDEGTARGSRQGDGT